MFARPCAVARARGLRRPLVARAPQGNRHRVHDRPLADDLGTEAAEGGEGIGVGTAAGEDRLDGGPELDAGGYSPLHGVVSICRAATSALAPTPSPPSSGIRTQP